MKPTHQTKFGLEGNCFDACVATLLEIPLADLNYFRSEETWYADFQKWLEPRGLAYVEINCDQNPFYRFPLPVLAIGSGPSPREGVGNHAVVIELHQWSKKIIHDPHPSGDGIAAIKAVGFFVGRFT